MVPVATLTGVVITTKSNERIRRRELRADGERWRYEVEKDSAAVQRQVVVTFLEDSRQVLESMVAQSSSLEKKYKLSGLSKERSYAEARIDLLFWFLNKLHPMVTTLELEVREEHVSVEIGNLRSALRDLENELLKLPSLSSEASMVWLERNFPEYRAALGPVRRIKESAIEHLHPLPPEVLKERPPRHWPPRLSHNPLQASGGNS